MATGKDITYVLCVDRDNDLGHKTGIQGPVVGRAAVLEAAGKLALADPEESDANTLFAAVKKFDEVQKEFKNLEVVAITGHGKSGFASDKKLNEQLDALEKRANISGFILVTDGAEDDQVLPLLQSRSKLLHKQTVIVRQAQQVESLYYSITEALKDPHLARIVFGIPGLVLFFYAVTLVSNLENVFWQGTAFIVGIYFLAKGLGIEARVFDFAHRMLAQVSPQRPSFFSYIGALFIFGFGIVTGIASLGPSAGLTESLVRGVQATYFFIMLAILFVIAGRAIDAVHFKKAYRLRKYGLYAVSTVLGWGVLDAGTLVFLSEGAADLNFFVIWVLFAVFVLLIAFRLLDVLDIRKTLTPLFVGLPVYDPQGAWLGKVRRIDKRANAVFYGKKEDPDKELTLLKREEFAVREGRLVVQG